MIFPDDAAVAAPAVDGRGPQTRKSTKVCTFFSTLNRRTQLLREKERERAIVFIKNAIFLSIKKMVYLIAANRAAALLLLEGPPLALIAPPLMPLLGEDWLLLLDSSGISIVPK